MLHSLVDSANQEICEFSREKTSKTFSISKKSRIFATRNKPLHNNVRKENRMLPTKH